MNPVLAAKISALVAALAAITLEDILAVKQAGVLGPDIPVNIQTLQRLTASLDDETVALLNQARKDAGLETV